MGPRRPETGGSGAKRTVAVSEAERSVRAASLVKMYMYMCRYVCRYSVNRGVGRIMARPASEERASVRCSQIHDLGCAGTLLMKARHRGVVCRRAEQRLLVVVPTVELFPSANRHCRNSVASLYSLHAKKHGDIESTHVWRGVGHRGGHPSASQLHVGSSSLPWKPHGEKEKEKENEQEQEKDKDIEKEKDNVRNRHRKRKRTRERERKREGERARERERAQKRDDAGESAPAECLSQPALLAQRRTQIARLPWRVARGRRPCVRASRQQHRAPRRCDGGQRGCLPTRHAGPKVL